jgi:integrin beta 3
MHNLTFPVQIYRDYWKRGGEYRRGDSVSYGGSTWIARRDNPEGAPNELNPAEWHMIARRGRDGKDGKDGKHGQPGPEGKPGLHHFQPS